MMYPPLQHGLARHLSSPNFRPGGQSVYVGTRPTEDGWVFAVIRVDDCTEPAAVWLGSRISADLLAHLRFTNQEDVPDRAVTAEVGVPAGGSGWSVAVYVELASVDQAISMKAFLTTYANAGAFIHE